MFSLCRIEYPGILDSYLDRDMNEYLTDVATVYIGFYDIMTNGYFRHGYLTTNNLKYVRRCIKRL